MDYSTRILGSNTVTMLRARSTAPILTIGADEFDRSILSGHECFNFPAAASLNRAINKELVKLKVTDTKDLFDRVPPDAFVLPGIGAVALAVLGACFEAKRIGGKAPLDSWVHHHATDEKRDIVTFHTMKVREHQHTTKTVHKHRHSNGHTKSRAHLRVVSHPRAHKASA